MHEPIDRAMARAGYTRRPTPALLRKLVEALDPVDMSAIAQRAGTSLGTVKSWRNRHADFPAPIATLAIGPVFAWAEVESWLEGRRKPSRLATLGDDAKRVELEISESLGRLVPE